MSLTFAGTTGKKIRVRQLYSGVLRNATNHGQLAEYPGWYSITFEGSNDRVRILPIDYKIIEDINELF
jgi:hypothetical protein